MLVVITAEGEVRTIIMVAARSFIKVVRNSTRVANKQEMAGSGLKFATINNLAVAN